MSNVDSEENELAKTFRDGQELALKLIDILGLPEHIISLEIKFNAREIPTIRCEHYLYDAASQHLIECFSEYELVKK